METEEQSQLTSKCVKWSTLDVINSLQTLPSPFGFAEFSWKIWEWAKAAITSGASMGTVVWISLWNSSSCAFALQQNRRQSWTNKYLWPIMINSLVSLLCSAHPKMEQCLASGWLTIISEFFRSPLLNPAPASRPREFCFFWFAASSSSGL